MHLKKQLSASNCVEQDESEANVKNMIDKLQHSLKIRSHFDRKGLRHSPYSVSSMFDRNGASGCQQTLNCKQQKKHNLETNSCNKYDKTVDGYTNLDVINDSRVLLNKLLAEHSLIREAVRRIEDRRKHVETTGRGLEEDLHFVDC